MNLKKFYMIFWIVEEILKNLNKAKTKSYFSNTNVPQTVNISFMKSYSIFLIQPLRRVNNPLKG